MAGKRDLEEIVGEIYEIVYENEENGYKVADFDQDGTLITIVGYLPGVGRGERIKAAGRWVNHAVYGEQFKVELYEKEMPKTENAILKYLSSGILKGVRESTAKKIVAQFGKDALHIIETQPLKLAAIKGISAEKAVRIQQSYIEQQGASSLVMFLQGYGISVRMAAKIYKKLGPGAVALIEKNPYLLCDEIDGIGFKTADKIAMSMGKETGSAFRVRAGTLYTLKYNTQFGHTYLPRQTLCGLASELMGVPSESVNQAISQLVMEGTFVIEQDKTGERIYDGFHYLSELYVAKRMASIASVRFETDEAAVEAELLREEAAHGIEFAHLQKEAVKSALEYGAMVITGGPGTGKTTIITTIISLMKKRGYKVVLTAPTGRAAKRMSQVCQMEAKTIHRLLGAGYSEEEDKSSFSADEENPILADVIIVDEMSMVDISLMHSLLRAVQHGTRLVLVGDVDQLPSVGPGNVLKDIIDSGVVKVIRLTEIFRQAEKSKIVVNAHRINKGQYPICNEPGTDFFFANLPAAAAGADYILSLCAKKLPAAYGLDPYDIQVLCPAKKGIAGVLNLNGLLQETLNPKDPSKAQKEYGDIIFREGDKVMQIKNNYDLKWTDAHTGEEGSGVFNGDVGIIYSIHPTFKTMTVMMDERRVVYDFKDLEELDLAYAITVHKSQGSEFGAVIIPVYDGPYMLINRNLFYTAVTRAKKLVVLVGSEPVMHKMVDNNKEARRYSGLLEKLRRAGETA